MSFTEWLYESKFISGRLLTDYGALYEQHGLCWGLAMALRQRDGNLPHLNFKWSYGSQISSIEIEASPEFLDKLKAAVRDASERIRTLPADGPPMTFFQRLFAAFSKGTLIVDYGMIHDRQGSRPSVSLSLRQRGSQGPILWFEQPAIVGRRIICREIVASEENLQKLEKKLETIIQDVRARV